MNKKMLPPRRLALNRETLLRLDERRLSVAGNAVIQPISQGKICTSPLCVETTCMCAENAL